MPTFRTDWKEDRKKCHELALKLGLTVSSYNPGDGTKVRVHEGLGKDWFDSHPILLTDGKSGSWMQARIFLEGYEAGQGAVNRFLLSLRPDA